MLYRSHLPIPFTKAQAISPHVVGRKKASAVMDRLPVSLRIVKRVVEQGQCIKLNRITQTAVSGVHPLARSKTPSD